jgi:hypothetical protein
MAFMYPRSKGFSESRARGLRFRELAEFDRSHVRVGGVHCELLIREMMEG